MAYNQEASFNMTCVMSPLCVWLYTHVGMGLISGLPGRSISGRAALENSRCA